MPSARNFDLKGQINAKISYLMAIHNNLIHYFVIIE